MIIFGIFRDEKCIVQVNHLTYRNAYSMAFSRMRQLSGLTEDEFKSKIIIMQGKLDKVLARIHVSDSTFEIRDLSGQY